jgi:hypothetical protein
MAVADRQGDVELVETRTDWTLPMHVEAFLNWLDDSKLAQDTQDALDVFMRLPVAKKMPLALKDDLRADGYGL